MIRISRPSAPKALVDEEAVRLLAARAIVTARPLTGDDFDGYRVVAADLWKLQHHKCCYCERPQGCRWEDVEHFRPKAQAQRGPGFSTDGYWWLAWTWGNLLYACPLCNRTHKGAKFPLAVGSVPLIPEQVPPGGEIAALINPADPNDADPMDHIEFALVARRWRARGRTPRGRVVIDTLGLDSPEQVERYGWYVARYLADPIAKVVATMTTDDTVLITAAWVEAVRFAEPEMLWSALAHDALAHSFPPAARARWGLVLPRPQQR